MYKYSNLKNPECALLRSMSDNMINDKTHI